MLVAMLLSCTHTSCAASTHVGEVASTALRDYGGGWTPSTKLGANSASRHPSTFAVSSGDWPTAVSETERILNVRRPAGSARFSLWEKIGSHARMVTMSPPSSSMSGTPTRKLKPVEYGPSQDLCEGTSHPREGAALRHVVGRCRRSARRKRRQI
jgi:hypothetical protein